MGMPKGLAKATSYYNQLAAKGDWQKLAAEMTAAGFADLVAECQPPEGAGWRKIDRAIARLKAAVAARQKARQA
jgi:hypothetical protein